MAGRAQGQEGGGGAHAAASGGGGGARSVLGALTGSDGSGAAATERARASMSSRELAELRGKVTRWDGPAGAQRGREAGRGHSGRGGVPEGVRDGAVAGVLVVGVLGAAAVAVRAFQGGGGRRERDGQGKWVRDRSLGGRLVKVEGRGGKGVEGLNPLEGVATDGLEREGSPRGRTGERGSERREVAMPSWWERPRGAAPPESVRERAKKDAQSLLRRMEAEKVASGRDIPLEVSRGRICEQRDEMRERDGRRARRDRKGAGMRGEERRERRRPLTA